MKMNELAQLLRRAIEYQLLPFVLPGSNFLIAGTHIINVLTLGKTNHEVLEESRVRATIQQGIGTFLTLLA